VLRRLWFNPRLTVVSESPRLLQGFDALFSDVHGQIFFSLQSPVYQMTFFGWYWGLNLGPCAYEAGA
jgi:hypothetical protein